MIDHISCSFSVETIYGVFDFNFMANRKCAHIYFKCNIPSLLAQVGLNIFFSQKIGLFFLWINSKFLPKIAFSKIGIYHDMSKYVPLRPFMWFVRDSFGNIWSIWIGFDVTYSEIDRPAWFTFLRMAYWSQKPICLDSVSVLLNIIRILFHICYGMHFYYIYTYEYIPDEN